MWIAMVCMNSSSLFAVGRCVARGDAGIHQLEVAPGYVLVAERAQCASDLVDLRGECLASAACASIDEHARAVLPAPGTGPELRRCGAQECRPGAVEERARRAPEPQEGGRRE